MLRHTPGGVNAALGVVCLLVNWWGRAIAGISLAPPRRLSVEWGACPSALRGTVGAGSALRRAIQGIVIREPF